MKKLIRRWLLGTDDLGQILATEQTLSEMNRQLVLLLESGYYTESRVRDIRKDTEEILASVKRIELVIYSIQKRGIQLPEGEANLMRRLLRAIRGKVAGCHPAGQTASEAVAPSLENLGVCLGPEANQSETPERNG